jgi:hypothetical protein
MSTSNVTNKNTQDGKIFIEKCALYASCIIASQYYTESPAHAYMLARKLFIRIAFVFRTNRSIACPFIIAATAVVVRRISVHHANL